MVSALQYIYYTALQRQQERLLARRLTRQQRHLHYMHHHGSDSDSLLPVTSVGGRPSDEVSYLGACVACLAWFLDPKSPEPIMVVTSLLVREVTSNFALGAGGWPCKRP